MPLSEAEWAKGYPDMYSTETPLMGQTTFDPGAVADWADNLGCARADALRDYLHHVRVLSHLTGLDGDLLVAQSLVETTSDEDDAIRSGVPWASDWWADRINPAGIGITGDPIQDQASRVFMDGEDAARAHVLHMWGYVQGLAIPPGTDLQTWDDPRWEALRQSGWAGSVRTIGDLSNKWAADPGYGTKIVTKARLLAQLGLIEEANVAEYSVVWPGLPGGAISFSFPSRLNIVPAWRTTQRPGIKARQTRRSIQHENGNPNADAKADSTYLYNGAGGRSASWHASVDHTILYINLPADEVGWQAGDGSGPGNMNGFAVELCQKSWSMGATTWRQARRNAAEVMGRVSARLKCAPPHEQHNDYSSYSKNCPEKIRGNSTHWAEYKADWTFFYNDELRRMTGGVGGGEPGPTVPKYGITDVLATTVNLNLRRTPGVAGTLLTTLAADTQITVTGRSETADGFTWIPVKVTDTLSGYVAESGTDGTVYVKMVTDNPDPVAYAPRSPIPALLDTDVSKEENVSAIEADDLGNEFIYVRDVIEFTKETVAGQYASATPRAVKPPYKVGERVLAAWLVRNTEDVYYYVLTGGDDEWVRVPVANTKWIADAPLQGDEDAPEEPTT